jgi:uncharacterized protein (TIGR03437 family)
VLHHGRFLFAIFTTAALCVIVWQSARTESPLRRITNTTEEGVSTNPSLSGDGHIVVFESTEDIAGAGGSESLRAIRANVAVDPASFLQIGATRAPAPAISQDGSRVAFASKDNPLGTNSDANSEIFLHDGAKLIQITNTSPGNISNRVVNGNFQPSISDDGRFIAFSSNRDLVNQNADGNLEIFVYDSVALAFTQLTNSSGNVGLSDAKISGNGASVAYIRDPGATPSANRDLLLQNRVGSSAIRVLATNAPLLAMTYGRAISDDGTRIVWSEQTATNSTQVFLFDGRNNLTRQITALGARASDVPLHASISGNGSCISFATRRNVAGTGNNSDSSVELYTLDIPSGTFGRVTNVSSSSATADVVSSLNDDGSIVAFNFPRIISGPVARDDFANDSEIYISETLAPPSFGTLKVVNRASMGHEPNVTREVAADSIAAALGSALAFTSEQSQRQADGTFPTTVGGTTVTVNGQPAQIFFVSPTEVHFHVPVGTSSPTTEVIVTNADGFQSRASVPTVRSAPGVFTKSGDGLGEGMILNADTLQPGPFDPSEGNLRLIVFSTGARNGSSVSVNAGGQALSLDSIVSSPNMPGLDEVHVLVPADLRGTGNVDLVIRADVRDSNPATVEFLGDARRDVMINEFLSDPPDGSAGDANNDAVRDSADDEFVELVNTTTHDINLSGYRILTRSSSASSDTVRHEFAFGMTLPACTSIVVFGGGNPNPNDPIFAGAHVFKAQTGGLSLANSGGVITLRDGSGDTVNSVAYGGSTGLDGNANQSLTRAPDISGPFTLHQPASGSGGRRFSPGIRLNGNPFAVCSPISRIDISPLAAMIEMGQHKQFTAHAFDANGNEVPGVIFLWWSSNISVANIDQNGLAMGNTPGTAEIRASGRGVTSAPPAVLTVNPATPVLTSVVISPTSATIGVGETQQFTAQAKDQFNQNIGDVSISFASNNTTAATVDAVGPTSGTGSATATVSGRATGSAEIRASATNGTTTVTSSAATLTVEPGAGELLISEFRTRGPSGASDEFVEIYNPTTSTLTIGGLKIRASNASATISDRVTITLGTTLGPGCHYLLANSSSGGFSGSVSPNQTYGTGITDEGGIAITGSNVTRIIDAVGMGSGSAYKEGNTLAPLSGTADQSYERKPAGTFGSGVDTNNNAGDFRLTTPSNSQNSSSGCLDTSSADLSIAQADSPEPVTVGANVTYTLTLTNNGAADAQNVTVTDNLPAAVTFVSCGATGGGVCDGSGNNRTVTFLSLASGSSATITLVVTANGPAGTTITNTATVTSATPDSNTGNNSATANTFVQAPLPGLSINDVATNETNSGTTTFSFTVSLSAPAPAAGIKFDIATQDDTATAAGGDYVSKSLTSQIIPAGQAAFTFDVTVNGDTLVESNETFLVNVTNVSGATAVDSQGQGTIQNDDNANLVISQVYSGGGNAGAQFTHDFVEIFNRGTTSVSFTTTPYSVQYAGPVGSLGSSKVDLTTGTMAPGQYFLVQLSGGANGAPLPTPDASGSIAMAATAGKVALVAGTTALTGSGCPLAATVADFVGYGTTANCFEGFGPAPAPSNTNADLRKAGGCTDTNDNAADFLFSAPFPRNTSSPVNNCVTGTSLDLTINDVSQNEGNGGPATFSFTVSLSAPAPTGGVTFDIGTQDNTATVSDNDYVTRSLPAQTIPSGSSTYNFDVTINGDTNIELNETFFANVSNVSGATVADGQGQGIILNDDSPTLTVNDVSESEGNSGTTTFTFTVTSSLPAPTGGITFDIATADGTGHDDTPSSEDNDYIGRSLTGQTIAARNTTYTFDVTVNGDALVEANETFFVNLTSVDNATVLDGQGLGTIQNDDTPLLVISQVYGGGGNTGATYTNDFIEIFNRGTTTVDFSATPYSVQYAAATSNFSTNKTNVTSGILLPGQYFLIQEGSGGAVGAALPPPDASGTINLAAAAGKVALVTGTTDLTGSACPLGVTIADFLGYGSTANCFETTPISVSGTNSNGRSVIRTVSCTDTNNNFADFSNPTAAPVARNTATTPAPCP